MPEVAPTPLLHAAVARSCDRLAALVDATPWAAPDVAAATAELLRELAGEAAALAVATARPPDGPGPEPLALLAYDLGATAAECDVVVLAGLADHHEALAATYRLLHPADEPWPTLGLAAQLATADGGARRALRRSVETGPLATCLRPPADDVPAWERPLRLVAGLWPVLAGEADAPAGDELGAVPGDPVVAGLDGWLARSDVAAAVRLVAVGAPVVVVVTAADPGAALERARALVGAAGRRSLALRPARLDGASSAAARAHAAARGAVPVVAVPDAGPVTATPGGAPLVLGARRGGPLPAGAAPVVVVDAPPLQVGERLVLWGTLLPELDGGVADLAATCAAEPAEAALAAGDARVAAASAGRPCDVADVVGALGRRAAGELASGVRLVHPVAGWDDLVLPAAAVDQLRRAAGRARHAATVLGDWGVLAGRPGSAGLRLLLAGPSGTGKSLAAEVLARDLGADLLVCDLSQLVSKWIGETEKNLAAAFDAAERTRSVLLFDEADALFGERTAVHDARDRYANLETAYLLARLERFDGLAVLTTNLRSHLDGAFTRRLDVVVELGEPDLAAREALWRRHLPAGLPLAPDVDVATLAELYPVVGATVRNATLGAAFAAAADGRPVSMRHLVDELALEYRKAGRTFPGAPPPAPAPPAPPPPEEDPWQRSSRQPPTPVPVPTRA